MVKLSDYVIQFLEKKRITDVFLVSGARVAR
jgi:Ethanolamine utilization protein EutJ (predicted chaperonin)